MREFLFTQGAGAFHELEQNRRARMSCCCRHEKQLLIDPDTAAESVHSKVSKEVRLVDGGVEVPTILPTQGSQQDGKGC